MALNFSPSVRELFKPMDLSEIPATIEEAHASQAVCVLWMPGKKRILTSKLVDVGPRRSHLVFSNPKGLSARSFLDHLISGGSPSCFVNISLQNKSLFFITDVLQFSNTGLIFSFPKEAFQVQRRKHFRVGILKPYVLRASFTRNLDGTKYTARLLDLSVGGLALVAPPEAEPFKVGEGIGDIRMIVGNRPLVCDGEVRYSVSYPKKESATRKLGIQFTYIDSKDAKRIKKFVAAEARAYFSRLMKKS